MAKQCKKCTWLMACDECSKAMIDYDNSLLFYPKEATNESKIFSDNDIKLINARLQGSKKDLTGSFSKRIRPKIKEMLNEWLPRKKELERLLK